MILIIKKMSINKILFKKTQFLKETWSYIAPTWEEMGQICLDLGVEILENHKKFDTLITLAKEDTLANRRLAFARIHDRDAVTKLFNIVAKRSKERQGGYTRILKCGFRAGDSAPMAIIEWVDRERSFETAE